MMCGVAGITADANILINYIRLAAQRCKSGPLSYLASHSRSHPLLSLPDFRYYFTYQETIPCEQLVQKVCDLKQGYTQHGGLRPFGVSFLFAGWDEHFGFQLYESDPSGNYGGWKVQCVWVCAS